MVTEKRKASSTKAGMGKKKSILPDNSDEITDLGMEVEQEDNNDPLPTKIMGARAFKLGFLLKRQPAPVENV